MRISFDKHVTREFGWIARPMDYAPRSLPGHAYWPKNRRLKQSFRCVCGRVRPANRHGSTPYLNHVKLCTELRMNALRHQHGLDQTVRWISRGLLKIA